MDQIIALFTPRRSNHYGGILMSQPPILLPQSGKSREDIFQSMEALRAQDVRWREGRAFSLVFSAGDEVNQLLKDAYGMFFSENGLNPTAFPSLRRFETEVVSMAAGLLGGDAETCGNMTSGGTESLLLAVLTARQWARAKRPQVAAPEMILPSSAHPAFDKAAHYFGVRAVRVPVRGDFTADVEAMARAITSHTILLVGSAPSYPQGVMDSIGELGLLAAERGLLCHVDACVGGFMLPFVRKLGYPLPDFDFSVPGVTSISADLHKFGYAAKGASVILYRWPQLRRYQFFITTDWSGGIYPSPTLAGTRPGGTIAAAWAVLNYLGEDGYLRINQTVMETVHKIQAGVAQIPGLKILGKPAMSVMALAADGLNIYELGDEISARGWHLDRQQFPACLHLTVNYAHAAVADAFLADLAEAAAAARRPSLRRYGNDALVTIANLAARSLPAAIVQKLTGQAGAMLGGGAADSGGRNAAMYGLIGSLPNRGDLRELVTDLIDSMTRI
jgi:glutamate/tyrosine decarboxylase-like PLP-dependent enzyme